MGKKQKKGIMLLILLLFLPNPVQKVFAAPMYTTVPCQDKAVYLIFSAGYENGNTGTILDILKNNDVSAAFFLTGSYIERNSSLVRRMKKEHHIVGNHSYSHNDFTSCTTAAAYSEISRCAEAMKRCTGYSMDPFFCPPSEESNAANLDVASSMGYTNIGPGIRIRDYLVNDQPAVSDVIRRFTSVYPGAVLLMHTVSSADTQALDTIIKTLKSGGWRFGVLTELTDKRGKVRVKVKDKIYNGKAISVRAGTNNKKGRVHYLFQDRKKKELKKAPIKAGVYYVTAFMNRSHGYSAAVSERVRFRIRRAKQEVRCFIKSKIYDGKKIVLKKKTIRGTKRGSLAYYDCSTGKKISAPRNPGSYRLVITKPPTNNYYSFKKTLRFHIRKKTEKIQVCVSSKEYDGRPVRPVIITKNKKAKLKLSYYDMEGNVIAAPVQPGKYSLEVISQEDTYYKAAKSKRISFEIMPSEDHEDKIIFKEEDFL